MPVAFRHGVASGDPQPDSVVLWTRVSGTRRAVTVEWRVATGPDLAEVTAAGRAEARPEADFTVKVDAGGLQPGRTYWYGFEAGGARSPLGRTRTAPSGPLDRLRLGVVCCAHWTTGFFNAYGRLAQRDVDVVVHLGDYLYEDEARRSRGVRRHRPPSPIATLAGYRGRHGQYKTDPDLARLHQRHPVVAIWDDHEFAGNAWREGAARHDPDLHGDWVARRAAAAQAYLEWMPVRPPDPSDPLRLWRSLRFGDLCDLLLLDTRLAGREQPAAGRRPVVGVRRRDRSLLDAAQWRWLRDELGPGSPGPAWRLLASQVVMAPVHVLRVPPALERLATRLGAVAGGLGLNAGQWDGYPEERAALLELVAARPGDVVVLSGDLHSSWAAELNGGTGAGQAPVAVEFVTPSVSAPSFATALGPPRLLRTPWRAADGHRLQELVLRTGNPHVRFVETRGHGYVVLDVTPELIEARWWHVDTVARRSAGERLVAAWSVRRGEPRLAPA